MTPQVIVKKKKQKHSAHHGGAWKVAYADFVTAMMALFIVLWILGMSEEVKSSVAGYFEDPTAAKTPAFPASMDPKDTGTTPPVVLKQPTPDPAAVEMEKLRQEKEKIQKLIDEAPELDKIRNNIKVIVSDEGIRIEMIENSHGEGFFFEMGNASITPKAEKVLKLLGPEISKLPNKVAIEGHTDRNPYKNQQYSNWELSADRANAARRVMEKFGLTKTQICEVTGYADRKLWNSNNPYNYTNRRVSILIKPLK